MKLETRTVASVYGGSIHNIIVPRLAKFLAVYKLPGDYFGISYSTPDMLQQDTSAVKTWMFKVVGIYEGFIENNWTYVGTISPNRTLKRTIPTTVNYAPQSLPYQYSTAAHIASMPVQTSRLDIPSLEIEEREEIHQFLVFMSSSIAERLPNDTDTDKQLGLF